MNILDNALRSPEDAPKHPVVQWLTSRITAGDEIRLAIEMDSAPLGSSISELIILRKENGVDQAPQSYDWDDDLNTSFINLGIKAVDLRQEGGRFSRTLRTALRKVERKYGDGYMSAVLVELIDESDLGKDGEIGKIRSLIHSVPPERNSRSYNECRDMIANEIGGRARELRDKLKYSPEDIKSVMDQALARYLDERYSITSLRTLGWIDESGRTTR